ncbi:hypothetical protein PFISCL1PPCAC_28876, partial [Pristionchus fissidentatus]
DQNAFLHERPSKLIEVKDENWSISLSSASSGRTSGYASRAHSDSRGNSAEGEDSWREKERGNTR